MRRLTGIRLVYFEQYSDGLLIVQREKFKPLKEPPRNLEAIWLPDAKLSFQAFKSELIRNGVVNEHSNEWREGSTSIIKAYEFLTNNGFVKTGLTTKEIFQAFNNSFALTKVKHDRSLRDRKKTWATREKEKHWEDFYKNNFPQLVMENPLTLIRTIKNTKTNGS